MAHTQVILLERIESLGNMGEVVNVKPGYARNYLLPQKKALRASKENMAHYEAQKKALEANNAKQKDEAEKLAKKIEGMKVALIRQASEGGQLYGSVTARDIAMEISSSAKVSVDRGMVRLDQTYKMLGLFPVAVQLHPEVKTQVVINIARSPEEAEKQAKTGKALVNDDSQAARSSRAAAEATPEAGLEDVLEEGALEARKQKQSEEAEEAKAEAAKPKKAKKAKKEDAAAAEDEADAE